MATDTARYFNRLHTFIYSEYIFSGISFLYGTVLFCYLGFVHYKFVVFVAIRTRFTELLVFIV